jgi:ABC-type polysaccharide/polyol phosphate export permease
VNNYVLYATSGLVFWFFFSNVTNQSIGNIIGSSGLIKSLNIPAMVFPLSEMISELFNLMLTLIVYFILMHWFGMVYSLKLLLVLPCIILFCFFSFGLMLILSSLNVFFRDIGILWTTVQPALFYATPIAYPERMISGRYMFIVKCNPIYYFIKLGREILYNDTLPPFRLWMDCLILATGMYLLGIFVFNRLKNQFISAI